MEKILTEDPRMCDMDKIEGNKGSILSHVVKTWIIYLKYTRFVGSGFGKVRLFSTLWKVLGKFPVIIIS